MPWKMGGGVSTVAWFVIKCQSLNGFHTILFSTSTDVTVDVDEIDKNQVKTPVVNQFNFGDWLIKTKFQIMIF